MASDNQTPDSFDIPPNEDRDEVRAASTYREEEGREAQSTDDSSSEYRENRRREQRGRSGDDFHEEEPSGPDRQLVDLPGNPTVLLREDHSLSRKQIDPDCLKVMYRLIQHGHAAYLVGGGVRDLLIGKTPKDFDVATSALPEEVRSLFRNSRIIGRRFRLNHVFFGGNKIIEVATFRDSNVAQEATEVEGDDGETREGASEETMLRNDNVYGTAETDAVRRDLTINGLFYDPKNYAVIDYVGGIEDLKAGIIRIIGDPVVRFKEDPVRTIRAVRHAARTGFTIEAKTLEGISQCKELLQECPTARIHEEILKDLRSGKSWEAIQLFQEVGLLEQLLPILSNALKDPEMAPKIEANFRAVDSEVRSGREVSAPVLFLATHLELIPEDVVGDFAKTRSVISDLFYRVGATRREREHMEQIMVTAVKLFEATGRPQAIRPLSSRPHFEEALLLIQLTSANVDGDDCVRFWREAAPRRRHSHSRRGRGRPRV